MVALKIYLSASGANQQSAKKECASNLQFKK